MPLRESLVFVHNALVGTGLRDRVKIIASGKVVSAFHMLRLLALGADTVNAARAMMMALGCIQARSCHNDKCPTGIATQKPVRMNALDVKTKADRVANYHAANIQSLVEIIAGAGLNSVSEILPEHLYHRNGGGEIKTYSDTYKLLNIDALLSEENRPGSWEMDWARASADEW